MRLSYAPAAALATIVTTWRARVELAANRRPATRESSRAQYAAAPSWSKATGGRLARQQEAGAMPLFQLPAYNPAGPAHARHHPTTHARPPARPHARTLPPTLPGS
ncbi:hypothetical protein SVAN01_10456 [Stagonosporopsis vannaccii]|nr:hypothetical protein SVAN01_10456 [Stagonosporopsis vannaccii]